MRGRRGFYSFVVSQALGAFNDNAFKTFIALWAVSSLGAAQSARLIAVAGALFVVPFLVFSTHAGWLADRFDKRRLIVFFKACELVLLSAACLCLGSIPALMALLFLMGVHSAFFSPVKLAAVPELVADAELSSANGLVQATTFGGIILGTAAAGLAHPMPLLLAASVAGLAASLAIPRMPAQSVRPFELNPLPETARAFRQLRSLRGVFLATVGSAYFWFAAAIFQMNLVELARGPQAAWFQVVVALGIGGGSFLAGWLSREQVELGLVPVGALALVVCAFWLGTSISAAKLFALGAAAGIFSLPLQAFIQQRSPPGERGAIIASGNLLCFAALLGASAFFPLLQPGTAFIVIGCMTLAVAAYILSLLPEFFIRLLMYLPAGLLYRIHVRGLENVPAEGPALLVSNHVSFIDAFLIGVANRRLVRFLMFRAYYDLPVVHWFFKAMRCIPVSDRDGAKAMLKSLQEARACLQNGDLVCIFAEGEISRHGQLLRFKKGFERIVDGLDVPVVPVHLDQVWGSVFSFSGGRALFKRPRRVPYPVTVSFGKPLGRGAGAFECRQAILELGAASFSRRLEGLGGLGRVLLRQALRHPFRLAVADSTGVRWTYGGLLARAWLLGGALPGERVGILLPPSAAAALVNAAAALYGKTAVNLNYTLSPELVAACREKAKLSCLVTSRRFLEKLGWDLPGALFVEDLKAKPRFSLPRPKLEDAAAVIFTSGSTGTPKGVVLSQANILANVEAVSQVYELGGGDRVLGALPFFHSFGYTGTLWLPLLRGMGAVYHFNPLDAKRVGELASRFHATFLLGTPTFLQTYLRRVEPGQFESLRVVVAGAEKLRPELAQSFQEKFGVRPLEGYGATELSPVAAVNIRDIDWPGVHQTGGKPGTVGHPLPGVFMKVVDPESGAELAAGQPGLLLVKGPNVMQGYLDEPQRTAEALRDGYYVTGDIAALDADGFVTITDRLSRFSKIGGEMVPHVTLEEKLHSAAGAADLTFVVVSVPDDKRGERLVVLYRGEHDIAGLLSRLDVPNLWKPDARDFKPVEAFPLLGSGKLDLRKLKELACAA